MNTTAHRIDSWGIASSAVLYATYWDKYDTRVRVLQLQTQGMSEEQARVRVVNAAIERPHSSLDDFNAQFEYVGHDAIAPVVDRLSANAKNRTFPKLRAVHAELGSYAFANIVWRLITEGLISGKVAAKAAAMAWTMCRRPSHALNAQQWAPVLACVDGTAW